MALADCDAPVIPAPNLSSTDYIDRLNLLRGNLIRFSRFTFSGGAYGENPHTDPPVTGAYGNQKKALILPPGGEAALLDRTYGAATIGHNGGAYNKSFYAWIRGGDTAASFKGAFRDYLGGTLSTTDFSAFPATYADAATDQTFNVTATPTLFKWENIASDDADFYAAAPNNAVFKFFDVIGLSAGSEIVITEYQLQTNDFFAPFPVHLPWRPARGEEDLIIYAEYILATNFTEIGNKPLYKVMSSPDGTNLILSPSGVTRYIPVSGTSYALGTDPVIPGMYLRCENAAQTTITFTDEATHGLPPLSAISIRAHGAGGFVVSEDPGVTVCPNLQGVTGSSGQYDLVQYVYLGSDVWDTQ